MKRYEGFSPVRKTRRGSLTPGGYVVKIMKAEEIIFSNGTALKISFDVAEGEHTGFYADEYRNNTYDNRKWKGVHYLTQPRGDGSERDGWAVNAMNNFVAVLQESNPGYTWNWKPIEQGDFSQLRGKLLGALIGRVEWEYNGKTGWSSKCRSLIPAEDVRACHFEVPEDKPLKNPPVQTTVASSWAADVPLPNDDDLPF